MREADIALFSLSNHQSINSVTNINVFLCHRNHKAERDAKKVAPGKDLVNPEAKQGKPLTQKTRVLQVLQHSAIIRTPQPTSPMELLKPSPKKSTPKRFSIAGPSVQETELRIGDGVYARYHGDRVLRILAVANVNTPFPHYICELDGDKYLIPKLHLSTRSLISEVGGGNRRQLTLPV